MERRAVNVRLSVIVIVLVVLALLRAGGLPRAVGGCGPARSVTVLVGATHRHAEHSCRLLEPCAVTRNGVLVLNGWRCILVLQASAGRRRAIGRCEDRAVAVQRRHELKHATVSPAGKLLAK